MTNLMTMIKLLSFRRKKVLVPGELKRTFVIELINQDFCVVKEEFDGDHDNETEIDKEFDESREEEKEKIRTRKAHD